ncbi:MAG: ImmA/IrrE family metallo-endopeptidase, partial [Anaerolineae bacterium]|nr:ImmA/IrrE family metallo-endopeptidase [Anaerolineae bacterium]
MGISRNFVREKILPEWWDDRAAINPAGYAEAIGYISRSLSLDLHSLMPDRKIQWATHRVSKFKHTANVSESQLAVAQAIATRVAELAVHVVVEPYKVIPQAAQAIRNDILASGTDWVDLDSLLDYCWSHGIPVVPVTQFPNHARKIDGLATCADGRLAIAISKVSKHSAWLLFVLAHELGHIALGHLNKHAVVVDAKVEPDSKDSDEEAANRFANELLTGDPVIRYTAAKYLRA